MNYKDVLKKIYRPETGSIWRAPNQIWSTDFAKNKDGDGLHPSVVEKLRDDGVSAQLAPGSSKDYNIGSCTFKAKIGSAEKTTYFLLKLSMPYIIEDLLSLDRGWSGVDSLTKAQLKDFEWQIKMCKG
jgi:hypothetical protein